jgi:hypothetical protein
MKSTQIHRTCVGEREVSTVFVEGTFDEYAYYETAIVEPNGKHSILEWGIQLPLEADAWHQVGIILADKAQHYEER